MAVRINYTDKFLEVVATKNFVVSTDGSIYGHPDKEVISHLHQKNEFEYTLNYHSVLQRLFTVKDLATYPMIKSRCKLFTNNTYIDQIKRFSVKVNAGSGILSKTPCRKIIFSFLQHIM